MSFSTEPEHKIENDLANMTNKRKSRTPFQMGLDRFMNNKAAVVSTVVLVLLVLMSLGAPLLTKWDPSASDLTISDLPPSSDHWLGTNNTGQDLFARNLYGGRVIFLRSEEHTSALQSRFDLVCRPLV